MECDVPRSSAGWWALTGTPGTGKSSAARELPAPLVALEVGDLARMQDGSARRGPRTVDLGRLGRFLGRRSPPGPALLVGHLSHLLPIRRVIVLRCHPVVLWRRLRRRPVSPLRGRSENVAAEAIGLVEAEARSLGREVHVIDTTRRSPRATAARIAEVVARAGTGAESVDWLDDPDVPDLLLRAPS